MMRFGVLGTVAVDCGGGPTPVRWPMPRSVLAALLLSANRVVPADRLVDVVWGDRPPASAVASLHNHVMRLRTMLGRTAAGRIRTVAPGYLIDIADGDLDLTEFVRRYRCGRAALAASDWKAASRELTSALSLWRGEPLEDVTSRLLHEREVPQLTQMRLEALEARIDADLHLGRHEELIAELGALTAAHPLRERFHAQLMLAHYQAGRQAEALSAFQRIRELLAEELGVDPCPDLQRLHQQILAQELGPATPARWPGTVRPAQLPADTDDFTGRADQVALLTGLADAAGQPSASGRVPVCVVTGLAGIGKTSLAVHAAHKIRDRFPDGQLYAQLGGGGAHPAHSGQVLRGFLRGLGADPARIPSGESERAALFRSMLAGRRVLILLDDARDSGHIASLLPGTAGCAVIVTSRNPLADLPGARRLELGAMTGGQALELLSRIIGAERVQAEARAAAEVAGLCAGLPLALRIAGSRLAARPHWRIEDLAARLTGPGRLDELAVGALSVRASFAASYAGLRGDRAGLTPARAFRLLGLWEGPDISPPAAAALFGVDVAAAEKALEALLDRHLLEPAGSAGRYRLQDLLGVYAAERAREEEPRAERHARVGQLLAWYLHSTVAADQVMAPGTRPVPLGRPPEGVRPSQPSGPDQAAGWLEAELPNLHAAVRAAAARQDHETAWQLAAALAVAHWRTGKSGEAMGMLRESLRIRHDSSDRGCSVATLANFRLLLHHLGRLPDAVEAALAERATLAAAV
jgi:DNA-binding SARP family transcriptional activator